MIKDKNISAKVVKFEERKARRVALLLAIFYIPSLLTIFHYLYTSLIATNEITKFKFFTLSITISLIISVIISLFLKLINAKFYVRDKQELRQAFVLSFLLYSTLQLLYTRYFNLKLSFASVYIVMFIICNGFITLLFAFDYNVSKLGVYTDDLSKFIFYETERKFQFKSDLRSYGLNTSKNPLLELNDIINNQSITLPYRDDLHNIGKYYTYYIQRYTNNDRVYVLIQFSSSGRSFDEVISVNSSYQIDEYEKILQILNNSINNYLHLDN
ncbi:MAG: hypothetical protein ACK5NF_06495 [Bacilli bacterium]